jgi:hypothetical protein
MTILVIFSQSLCLNFFSHFGPLKAYFYHNIKNSRFMDITHDHYIHLFDSWKYFFFPPYKISDWLINHTRVLKQEPESEPELGILDSFSWPELPDSQRNFSSDFALPKKLFFLNRSITVLFITRSYVIWLEGQRKFFSQRTGTGKWGFQFPKCRFLKIREI